MFGGINVWRITKLKVIGEIKFGEWIEFSHKDTIYKLKFGWLKFGKAWMTRQIHQTFPLPNIPTIRYLNFTYSALLLWLSLSIHQTFFCQPVLTRKFIKH